MESCCSEIWGGVGQSLSGSRLTKWYNLTMNKSTYLQHLKERVGHYRTTYGLSVGASFSMWYAAEALGLEEDEAYEAASYDGANDKDIDLFYVDDPNERVVIGQFKYRAKGDYGAKKPELLSLLHTTDWLKDPEALRRDGRDDLAAAAEEFERSIAAGYSVEYLYVYCGPARTDVDDAARQFNVAEAGSVPSRSCRVVNLPALVDDHAERVDQSTRITSEGLKIDASEKIEEQGAFGKALVTTLSGEQIRALHSKYGDRLFDRNVRLFLGARKGGVNAGLRDTLASTSDRKNFWAYNNGITFVCDTYDLKDDGTFTLHNFSIVNGCQTAVSISNAKSSAAKDARVLTRFIAAPEKAIDSIIRYNNSQNPIKLWDLVSQDKLQKRIKKELGALPQPFLYVLRKGETRTLTATERKPFKRNGKLCVIQHDLNAQFLSAFRGLPAIAYKDKGKIFSAHYDEVYPPQIRAEEIVLAWQAGAVATQLVKKELAIAVEKDEEQRIAILKRGAKFFVIGVMGILLHCRNGSTFLNKIKPAVAVSKKTESRLNNYAIVALEWYVEVAQELIDTGTEITTIVRSQDHWYKIVQKIRSKWKVYSLSKKAVDEALPKL